MYRFTRIAICEYNKPQSDTVHNPVIRQGGRHGVAAAAAAVAAAAVAAAAVAGAGPTPASQIRHLAGWPLFLTHVPPTFFFSLQRLCAAIWLNSVTTVMRLQRFGQILLLQ